MDENAGVIYITFLDYVGAKRLRHLLVHIVRKPRVECILCRQIPNIHTLVGDKMMTTTMMMMMGELWDLREIFKYAMHYSKVMRMRNYSYGKFSIAKNTKEELLVRTKKVK
jgi:hypothetical protein